VGSLTKDGIMGDKKPDTEITDKIMYFEEEAQTYDEKRSQKMRLWWGKEVEIVSNLCGNIKEKQVLEIGVGTGRFSIELAKKGANITSLDPAKAMLMVTKEKTTQSGVTDKISLLRAVGHNLPFKNSSFDAIVCMHVLKHLSTYKDVLQEMERVTKQEGFIILNFPNALSFYLPVAIYSEILRTLRKHVYFGFFTKRGVRKALESSGFTVEKVRGFILLHPSFFPQNVHNLLNRIEQSIPSWFSQNFFGFLIIKARKGERPAIPSKMTV